MGFLLKNNENARKRLKAFWEGSCLGRPALYVTADNPSFTKKPWKEEGNTNHKSRDLLPEWHAWNTDNYLNSTIFLAEAMPAAWINWGSGLTTVAVLAGGDYEYHNSTAWIKPLPNLWDYPLPDFNPHHPIVTSLIKCFKRLIKVVGNKGTISPPVMLDAITTLSSLRTPKQLCIDLIETPEKVKQWSDALTRVYIDCYEYFYKHLSDNGYRDTSSWLSAMAEGRCEAVQCDFSVMISLDMYKNIVIPDLLRLTEYLDYSLYHLDGTCQMRFLDLLRALPKLNGIQWNPEPEACYPLKWIDAFREIRKRNFSIQIGCHNTEEVIRITKELGPDGLLFVLPQFKNIEDAEKAIQFVEKAC